MANNIWAIVLSIIILLIILLILWFLFRKKLTGSSKSEVIQKADEVKDKKGQKVEEAQYRELNEEKKEKNENSDKDYKYDKEKIKNKLKELE